MNATGGFMLDKQNGKLGGVCAGLANYTGVSVGMIRILMIIGALVPIFSAFVWLFYGGSVIFCRVKPLEMIVVSYDRFGHPMPQPHKTTAAEAWAQYRALEQRLARIEAYYTGHNTSLARQIAALTENDASDARAMQSMIDAARAQARAAAPARPAFGRAVR